MGRYRFTRRALNAGLIALAAVSFAPAASAQNYPSQTIHVIGATPPGSGADIIVRYFAEKLRLKAGVPVIVENKVGAGGNIAAEYAARAKPDGYTIHIHAGSTVAANFSLFRKPTIDPSKDFQVVATLQQQPFIIAVAAASPYKNIKDLTAAMKAKGEKASYSEYGTNMKVVGEFYKLSTGVAAVDVPYKAAADIMNDFASGALDYGVFDPQAAIAHAQAGRIRMLAASTAKRTKAQPDLPTLAEEGIKGVEIFGWFAAFIPSGTPKPVVEQLNKWFNEILATDETREFVTKFGGDPWISSPAEGQAQLEKEQRAWQDYVKAAKLEVQ
jgi:tripartite-type tricarboxylate transporter receptor subunit TctC